MPFKIGQAYTGREIDWASLQLEGNLCRLFGESFTETRLEDVDLTKTEPCKYFVYMKRGNPSQELRVRKQQYCDTF